MSIQEETKNLKLQDKNETLQATTENKDQQMEPKHKMRVGHIEYNGPLPIPSHLKAYNDIVPGAADRIIAMAEKEAEHRHDMESKAIEYTQKDSRRGQLFAFIIVMTALIGGIVLILNGKGITGLVSLASALAMLAGAFIYNNRDKNGPEEP